MVQVSDRVTRVENPLRDILVMAKTLEAKGKKLYYLNIGDPNKFDFDVPEHIKSAYISAIKGKYGYYAPAEGDTELRKAIGEKEGVEWENVIITSGLSEGLNYLYATLMNPGDNILLPSPAYAQYISLTQFYMGEHNFYECDENAIPIPDDLRNKINKRTKAIVINSPNNPTGAVWPENIIKKIVDIAGEYNIPIISDEIYDEIYFDEKPVKVGGIVKDLPLIIANGFSKVYLSTGYRVGYMVFNNCDEVRGGVLKMCRMRLSMNLPSQRAMISALNGSKNHLKEMVLKLKERRDFIYNGLKKINGISCAKPRGAFYIFPRVDGAWKNDREFVYDLLSNTGVVGVFGSGFSTVLREKHFRLVFLPPVDVLREAVEKIEEFMGSLTFTP